MNLTQKIVLFFEPSPKSKHAPAAGACFDLGDGLKNSTIFLVSSHLKNNIKMTATRELVHALT